jgi:hypothetical protein
VPAMAPVADRASVTPAISPARTVGIGEAPAIGVTIAALTIRDDPIKSAA